jgi:hypothetical protein
MWSDSMVQKPRIRLAFDPELRLIRYRALSMSSPVCFEAVFRATLMADHVA